jgi:ceramide glucosyltransferase
VKLRKGRPNSTMSVLSYLGTAWFAIALAIFLTSCFGALLQPFVQRRRAKNVEQPSVTAVMPIKLEHSGFEIAQASTFAQDYPDYEVLFSAAEAESPALETAFALKASHPDISTRILRSQADFAVSPKLNTLDAPISAAANDFILVKDSNIALDRDTLSVFMQNFATGVGLVVGVPVAEGAETLAGHIEAAIINTQARLLLTVSTFGFGFGVGKVMLFRRSDLAEAGGIDAVGYTLAEDTALARGLETVGLRTVFAHRTLRQLIGWRNLREVYDRQVRWSVIRHAHEPLTFPLEPVANAIPAALAAALGASHLGLHWYTAFVLTLAGWFLTETCFAALKGWQVSAYAPLAFLGREVISLAAWLRAWTTNDVVWQSGRLDVFVGARTNRPTTFEFPPRASVRERA